MADFPEHTAQEVDVWVHAQMWNWSAWCWDGPWPHPLPVITCASAERHYRPRPGDEDRCAVPRVIHEDQARIVDGIYQSLPLVEQRIVQFEYPRRYEFDEFNYRGELLRNVRVQKGCRILRIKQMYYRLTLINTLNLVKQAFLKQETKV